VYRGGGLGAIGGMYNVSKLQLIIIVVVQYSVNSEQLHAKFNVQKRKKEKNGKINIEKVKVTASLGMFSNMPHYHQTYPKRGLSWYRNQSESPWKLSPRGDLDYRVKTQ